MSTESFNFNSFVKDSVNTILKPGEYFASLRIEGGLGEPLIKAVIYGALSGVFTLLWSIFKLGAFTGGLFGSAVGIMSFFWAVALALLVLFIGGVITLVISAICGGNTDYQASLRITSSLMVLLPVTAFFGFLTGINFYLGFICRILINLYGLYLLYHALTGSLKANTGTAKIFTSVLAGILVIVMLVSLGTRRAANRFLDEFDFDTEKFEEQPNDVTDDMEETLEKLQEGIQDMTEPPDTLQ